jgi:outer membrane protein assembly factor BamA
MNSGAQPARTIQDIWFTGNIRLSTRKLAQAIGIKAGDADTKTAIDSAMAKIVAAYAANDSDLSLSVTISQPDAAHTSLHFIIDEHGTGGVKGPAPRSGARMGGAPPPPSPATRQ